MTLLTAALPQHWNDTFVDNNNGQQQQEQVNGNDSNNPTLPIQENASSITTTTTATTTLGDIMGLVTESQSLAAHYGICHPLDRMALTANGNLQRLISSFYDAPVSVVVDYCRPRSTGDEEDNESTSDSLNHSETINATSAAAVLPPPPQQQQQQQQRSPTALRTWDRRVSLRVYGQVFCVATSVICVHDPMCLAAVESGAVGLGQLFRHLNVLPRFALQRAGTTCGEPNNDSGGGGGGGGFWREYSLSCPQLSCDIHEEFIPGLWTLKPQPQQQQPDDDDKKNV